MYGTLEKNLCDSLLELEEKCRRELRRLRESDTGRRYDTGTAATASSTMFSDDAVPRWPPKGVYWLDEIEAALERYRIKNEEIMKPRSWRETLKIAKLREKERRSGSGLTSTSIPLVVSVPTSMRRTYAEVLRDGRCPQQRQQATESSCSYRNHAPATQLSFVTPKKTPTYAEVARGRVL